MIWIYHTPSPFLSFSLFSQKFFFFPFSLSLSLSLSLCPSISSATHSENVEQTARIFCSKQKRMNWSVFLRSRHHESSSVTTNKLHAWVSRFSEVLLSSVSCLCLRLLVSSSDGRSWRQRQQHSSPPSLHFFNNNNTISNEQFPARSVKNLCGSEQQQHNYLVQYVPEMVHNRILWQDMFIGLK